MRSVSGAPVAAMVASTLAVPWAKVLGLAGRRFRTPRSDGSVHVEVDVMALARAAGNGQAR